jgi:hypothetical protein
VVEFVLKSFLLGLLFLHLPSLQNFFPPPVVHVGRRHVADPFLIALVIVKLNEFRRGPA